MKITSDVHSILLNQNRDRSNDGHVPSSSVHTMVSKCRPAGLIWSDNTFEQIRSQNRRRKKETNYVLPVYSHVIMLKRN